MYHVQHTHSSIFSLIKQCYMHFVHKSTSTIFPLSQFPSFWFLLLEGKRSDVASSSSLNCIFWWTQEIWTTQPIAAILMFGFPLLVFSFLIYMLCIADPGPEEEDLEELQDEGTEYLDDEDGERELKATEEEVDANPKPKTEWSILFGHISIVSSVQLRQLLPCQNRIDSKYSTRDVQVFLKIKWDWFSLTCIGSGIFSDWW